MPRMDTSDPAPHGPSPTSDRLSLDSRVLNDEGERLSKSKPDYQVPSLDLSDPFAVTILTVAAFAAGFVRGFTGFGGPAVMILLLVPFYAPISVLVKVAAIDILANFALVPSTIGEVDKRVVSAITLSAVAGLPFGMFLVFEVDPLLMKRAIAVIAGACTVVMLAGWRFKELPSLLVHAVVGFASGVILGATFIAFFIMMFLLASPASAAVSRANVIFWGGVMNVTLISMFGFMGAITLFEFGVCVAIGLAYMASARVGAALFRRTKERDFRQVVLWLMLALAGAGFVI